MASGKQCGHTHTHTLGQQAVIVTVVATHMVHSVQERGVQQAEPVEGEEALLQIRDVDLAGTGQGQDRKGGRGDRDRSS